MTRPGEAEDARLLMGTIRDLIAENRPAAAPRRSGWTAGWVPTGLDSLTLVELRSRVEEAFGVMLPDDVLGGETADDWLAAVRAARGGARPPPVAAGPAPWFRRPPAAAAVPADRDPA